VNALLENAYDLHVHSGPDVMPRKMDDVDMAQRIIASGMKGYAIKSHYFCTSQRAEIIRKVYPGCNALGTISLNSAVGGINPSAVEMAGRSGAKLVWFPTVDSEHEQAFLVHSPPNKLAYWAKIQQQMKAEGVRLPTICILKDGKLKADVFDVLDIIARFNMILATSHVSKEEAFALVKAAKDRKVERIIVTHADFPSTFYTIEEQKQMLTFGAFIEHTYTTPATGKVAWEVAIEQIRAIGAERIVLATDLGQSHDVFPDEGLAIYGEKLLKSGFSEKDVRIMIVKNPTCLIE
jgi:histidinol phosphatase-like PHP family hydrolase